MPRQQRAIRGIDALERRDEFLPGEIAAAEFQKPPADFDEAMIRVGAPEEAERRDARRLGRAGAATPIPARRRLAGPTPRDARARH